MCLGEALIMPRPFPRDAPIKWVFSTLASIFWAVKRLWRSTRVSYLNVEDAKRRDAMRGAAGRSASGGAFGELIHRIRIEFGGGLENPAHGSELILRKGDRED